MSAEEVEDARPLLTVGDWCWHTGQQSACQVVDRQNLWGVLGYRVWLPTKDAVVRAAAQELVALAKVRPSVDQVLHAAAAARLLDALETDLLLAPIQSSVVPLPHQLYALNRAMSRHRIRYLLADEVGLGKTIEAGLILREMKLRGLVRRALVVAPKGLVRQWQAEMRLHFNERFRFIEGAELAAFRAWRDTGGEDNPWRMHDQVIVSVDAVKPIDGRRGWSSEQTAAYNQERFEDLVSAGWDLVIVDEAHRLGGSTDRVARYRFGAALAEAAPYLLLLSATPHQGKTDQFLRLMQLLDGESFLDEGSIKRDRVQPFVIRTEKRSAIDADGAPLFKPRTTRLQPIAWHAKHAAQRRLYDAVTDYVRDGYNQALAAKQRHIGFLMILMQRLVTSSTAAIRTTLEKRHALLQSPQHQEDLFDAIDAGDWAELDGQSQLDMAVWASGWEREKAEVEMLLALAKETERQGTDAKAEALLELIYKLQQEENDPELKVLVFTEFVPTQEMLVGFLTNRGFSVARLNGGMDLDARANAQESFSREVRILVSTDAGGEGLNLQFCHVVVNFDIPWNPMRLEQRIGRVDRIGQPRAVRAFNFVLDETVEHRVREVLEEKLATIAQEFGVDKATDVMDSVDVEPIFDRLFAKGAQDPASIEQQCDEAVAQVRDKIRANRTSSDLLAEEHRLPEGDTRKWRDQPAQYWLERAVSAGLRMRGGMAVKDGDSWRLKWSDGSQCPRACFDARTAERRPEFEWITLEDPRARAMVYALPHCVAGQPVPVARVNGLPDTVRGVWSLWRVELAVRTGVDSPRRRRFVPVFVGEDGRSFVPTAKRIWGLLVTEEIQLLPGGGAEDALGYFEVSQRAAESQGEIVFSKLVDEQHGWVAEEQQRARDAYNARCQAIGRIGLSEVRNYRRKRLDAAHAARMEELTGAESCTPELNAVLMLRIGEAAMVRP